MIQYATKAGALTLLFFLLFQPTFSQTVLKADGPGNTYELINSVLAPNNNAIEVPDCNHGAFGRHIDEVFDTALNAFAFRFHIHTSPDNDRCIKFDRQRNEIKTYSNSPDSLKAVENETVRYRWKFKLDADFQSSSSFTHLHQIKAVGGSQSSMPSITLTARKGSPDQLELRYAENLSQTTLTKTDLDRFKGIWVEAEEIITFGEIAIGEYKLVLTRLSSGDTLFYYRNDAIRMWKTNATFLRPKWGIYRSLNNASSLRDEEVLFADFSIEELAGPVSSIESDFLHVSGQLVYPNPTSEFVVFSDKIMEHFSRYSIFSADGKFVRGQALGSSRISVSELSPGLYFIEFSGLDKTSVSTKVVIR